MQVLETERLTLHRMTPEEDAPLMLEVLNDPAFIENIGDRGVRDLDQARQYILDRIVASYEQYGVGMLRVVRKDDGAVLGNCGLVRRDFLDHVDIGFAFLRRYWAKGYATEAAEAVRDHAFRDLGLDRLVAVVSPHNRASIGVLRKLGFVFDRMILFPGDKEEIELYKLDP